MPSSFTPDDVRRIAALAQLSLTPAEVDHFATQLAAILAYAETVQRVDTTGVEPMSHPLGLSLATGAEAGRADQVLPCADRAEVLAGAPDAAREAGVFRVPRVINPDA
ncbi:MAG TPA: Asp-tRNA(Asn)/Glu-tRNA(Gln) amidotransferase subunit GatC [Vicinamibacterales bacterium]|nr:Asp-tRNA(Asn)/Glu-tRNA(Gln) amidotransferase subunit GatC [Vicinamibacterales bacterium]